MNRAIAQTAHPANPSRRRLLQAGASVLAVGFTAGCALPVIPKRPAPSADDASGWIRHAGGRYTLVLPRVEMGQAIATGLRRIASIELGVAEEALDVELHATTTLRPVRATVGSESMKDFAAPLAQACAVLRHAVAQGWSPADLQARSAEVPTGPLRWQQPGALAAGRRVPIAQGRDIVTGQPLFAGDVRLPGMCFGRVLRAPVSPELASRPGRLDEAAARAVPGFVALVRDARLVQAGSLGVGIVARTPGALDAIAQALAIDWTIDGRFDAAAVDAAIDIDARLQRGEPAHTVHGDRLAADGPWDVDLRIDVPLAAHAPIEPRCAVAQPQADGTLALWVGSQDVFYQRDVVARVLGLDAARVQVQGCRVGGAFGGKTVCTVELEAALLAVAVQAPVKVQWTRAQEFTLGFHRPPSSHRLRARLRDGRLQDWWHAFSSSHILFTSAVLPPWLQRLTQVVGDDGVARGAALPYHAARRRTAFDLVRLPVHTGPWRGLGAGPNGLAIESAIDACARHAGADPLDFRLAHLDRPDDAPLAGCLRAVAQACDWKRRTQPTMPPSHDRPRAAAAGGAPAGLLRGRGLACGTYKGSSHAAVVADVAVDAATGAVQVLQLWCAHDGGRVVDPDQVRAQCEGNLVWGLGMVLVESLPVGASAVGADNFAASPIPRIGQVPPMQVVLVETDAPPAGAGETAIVAAGATVANAVMDATGVRPQHFPLRPGDLLAALAAAQARR